METEHQRIDMPRLLKKPPLGCRNRQFVTAPKIDDVLVRPRSAHPQSAIGLTNVVAPCGVLHRGERCFAPDAEASSTRGSADGEPIALNVGVVAQAFRRTVIHDVAVPHHEHAVADIEGDRQALLDQQH